MFALLCGLLIWMGSENAQTTGSPTDGFTQQTLTDSNIVMQKPYDKNLSDRYSFVDGVHDMWVYSNDKPHNLTSNTRPRTEIRITGKDYKTGVWQFEGEGYVPRGTNGVCVMQIHGYLGPATVIMLDAVNGDLKRYHADVVSPDIFDRWFHLNVIHDTDQRIATVFVDGEERIAVNVTGGDSYYFKCGVYAQIDASFCMESRWRNIKLWSK
ncbi:hypothetical protein SUGI_1021630 [Cryptomeria japonica]|nr:hypothetical protein SUGI_1021630 [Cryptomeria japonica]